MRQTPHAQTPRTLLQQKPPPASGPQLLPRGDGGGDGRGVGAVRQRPLGNPGWGTGQTHVWVRGWPAARQECAGSRIPAPSAAAGANWKQSISLVRPTQQGGVRAPASRPVCPPPTAGGSARPDGMPTRVLSGGRRGAGTGHHGPWGRAPESVRNPPRQGPSLPFLRILPLPPPSPRKTRAPAPASLAGNPGLSNGGGGGGGGCWRNVTLGRRPRRAALLHGARGPGWIQSAGDSKEAPRPGVGSLLLEGTRPCRQQGWQVHPRRQ